MENCSELAQVSPGERVGTGRDSPQGRLPARKFRLSRNHALGILRHRLLVVAVSVFAVLIMLISGLPSQAAQHATDSGLVTNTTPAPPVPTFYPYLEPTSNYPLPDTMNWSTEGIGLPGLDYLYPQIVSTVAGGVPTFYM